MSESPANAESHRRGGGVARRLEWLRQFPFTLVLCAILSVIFVIAVAAFIAFMQYQARLLRSEPGITASQLVYYVDTEQNIEQELKELSALSETISNATPDYTNTNNEINFRIERICSLFQADPDAKEQMDKCHRFLNQIPFQGATNRAASKVLAKSVPSGAAKHASDPTPPIEEISEALLNSIIANFIQVMGPRKFGDVELSKVVLLFGHDMGKIAELNQDYWLRIRPQYLQQFQQYKAKCQHLNQLVLIVSTYRTIDPGCDPNMDIPDATATPGQAAGSIAQPAIAVGGNIISGADKPADTAAPSAPPPPQPSTAAPRPAASDQSPAPVAPGQRDQTAPEGAAGTGQGPADNPASGDIPKGGSIISSPPPVMSPADRARAFELVTHYRFYDRISGGKLRDILISPNDFLALVLVGVAGVLGALLRIVFASYTSGKDPTARSVLISPILGLICSLVIYNLFRSGFIVLTDQPQSSDTVALSPFVIALLAIAAGMLSERTIEFFRKTSNNWLGSVEASQAARWAVNLQRELDAQTTTAEKLAERLDVSAAKLKEWAQEKEPVPMDKQRDIAIALNVPVRRIFTDIEPAGAA